MAKDEAQPAQEPVARVSLQWLAEMILSDCGHSSNYTPLLDRVKARIEQWERANSAPTPPAQPAVQEPVAHSYASTQATMCACCGEHKHTPLRIDKMGGYVCLTCIDKKLGSLLGEFGHPPAQPAPAVQEPVALGQEREAFEAWHDSFFVNKGHAAHHRFHDRDGYCIDDIQNQWKGWKERAKRTTPPAAQRQWVGLTDEERNECTQSPFTADQHLAIEAKLKEKNT